MAEFKIGQKVKWKSQAGGYSKEKVGTVKFIVPADQVPAEVLRGSYFRCDGAGLIPRGHVTYLVGIGNRAALYWPRVQYLVAVSE